MVKLKLRFAVVNSLATGWLYLVCAQPALGATLGALQLRSALGEPLNASIPVSLAEGEELTAACFRLVGGEQNEELQSLRQAHITFDQKGSRGLLQIRTDDAQLEPLLGLAIRVQCVGDTDATFVREYQIMLDPRERLPAQQQNASDSSSNLTDAASSALPGRRNRATKPVDAGSSANASAPVTTSHKSRRNRHPADATLPLRKSDSQLNLQSVPPAAVVASSATPQLVLRLSEPEIPAAALAPLSPADAQKRREELAALNLDQAAQLTQMETRLAELNARILALQAQLKTDGSAPVASASTNPAPAASASAPQAARHPLVAVPVTTPVESGISGWWWLLLPVVVIAALVALIYWRSRRQWRAIEDDEVFEPEVEEDEWPAPTPRPVTPEHVAPAGLAVAAAAAPVADTVESTAASDADAMSRNMGQGWHDADVDVVQPDNVSDEAQLLIEHGLPEHAITLLSQEIEMRPNSLALWMKLFEAYRLTGLKEEFQEKALAFGVLFASDSLWHQVQDIGRTLDPANPLYHSVEEMDDEPAPISHAPAPAHIVPRDTSAFDPLPALDPDAPLEMSQRLPDVTDTSNTLQTNRVTVPDTPTDALAFEWSPTADAAPPAPKAQAPALIETGDALEFSLQPNDLPHAPLNAPEIQLQPEIEGLSFEATPIAETAELQDPFAELMAEAVTTPEDSEALVATPVDESFDLAPAAEPQTEEPFDLQPPTPLPLPDEAGWQSTDPAMQKIAAMLERGETESAFRTLEELLYTGNGEQRQIALKWLERLYPAKRA